MDYHIQVHCRGAACRLMNFHQLWGFFEAIALCCQNKAPMSVLTVLRKANDWGTKGGNTVLTDKSTGAFHHSVPCRWHALTFSVLLFQVYICVYIPMHPSIFFCLHPLPLLLCFCHFCPAVKAAQQHACHRLPGLSTFTTLSVLQQTKTKIRQMVGASQTQEGL